MPRCLNQILTLSCVLAFCSLGCSGDTGEKIEEIGQKFKDTSDKTRDAAAARLQNEIQDYLTCAGVARPSTIQAVRDVLTDKEKVKLNDLLMAPKNFAQLVGLAGVTVEGSVLAAQNFRLLLDQGLVQDLVQGRVDTLSCGDTVTLACTAGTGDTLVNCDPNQSVTSVGSTYNDCTLTGRTLDGGVITSLNDDDSVSFELNGLSINDKDVYRGTMTVSAQANQGQSIEIDAIADPLVRESFGGAQGELSCGQTMTLSLFSVEHTEAGDLTVALDGRKETKKDTYAFKTSGEHLKWNAQDRCSCPIAGSAFEMDIPEPLGREGTTATLRVTFESGSGACSQPVVSVLGWPEECSKVTESPFGDCGRSTIEQLVTPLLGAMCQPLESE